MYRRNAFDNILGIIFRINMFTLLESCKRRFHKHFSLRVQHFLFRHHSLCHHTK